MDLGVSFAHEAARELFDQREEQVVFPVVEYLGETGVATFDHAFLLGGEDTTVSIDGQIESDLPGESRFVAILSLKNWLTELNEFNAEPLPEQQIEAIRLELYDIVNTHRTEALA